MASREIVLRSTTTITADGNSGTSAEDFIGDDPLIFELRVDGPVTGTSPTLNVTIEDSIDGGTTWHTLTTFTQATAVTREVKRVAQPVGRKLRASWTTGGTTPSFGGVSIKVG